ncbi:hypothetical protein [Streptomyces abikoensis]|uniref:hypothetical protein n=1 Tax=Streptomyces abikoensis TaxID=97398 RepID=UPI00199AEDE0|nr:hypothetical protein [Streptomyces abikoensis]GGP46749.1 hypothetical protein GCM10010214_19880 [Streptomyces abikoensis]
MSDNGKELPDRRPGLKISPDLAENELTVALRRFWWLHDARWYQGVKKRFGQEVANEINAEALRFVGRRVGVWYANAHGVPDGSSPTELAEAVAGLTRTMMTEQMLRCHIREIDEESLETIVTEFFALRMLKAARSLEGYQCPCLDMRDGWFEGLGVKVEETTVECMRTGGRTCQIYTKVGAGVPRIEA